MLFWCNVMEGNEFDEQKGNELDKQEGNELMNRKRMY